MITNLPRRVCTLLGGLAVLIAAESLSNLALLYKSTIAAGVPTHSAKITFSGDAQQWRAPKALAPSGDKYFPSKKAKTGATNFSSPTVKAQLAATVTTLVTKKVNDESLISTHNSSAVQRDPRIAFITYAYLAKPEKFVTLIFGARDTFVRDEPTLFVVMTNKWKRDFTDLCEGRLPLNETITSNHTVDCSRLTPIWVDCVEGFVQPAPSCKLEKGLLQIWAAYQDDYDWFLYMDDDNYMRTHVVKSYLSILDPTQAFVVGTSEPRNLGNSYFCPRCRYNCSVDDPNFKSMWGQPIIYSKAGLARVVGGFRLGGMVATCAAYTAFHDVGIGVFNWIYSLPALSVGMTEGSRYNCYNKWTEYKKKLIIGYHGVANDRHPGAELTMEAVHEFHETTRVDYKKWATRSPDEFEYLWHNATGFRQTMTYMKWGDPVTWKDKWRYSRTTPDCVPFVDSKDRPTFHGRAVSSGNSSVKL